MSGNGVVRVEVAELDGQGNRQIGNRRRPSELLQDRADDIRAAIAEVAKILRGSVDNAKSEGLSVSSIEATFGITLTAEAGVLLSKASAEASFEVVITIDRAQGDQ